MSGNLDLRRIAAAVLLLAVLLALVVVGVKLTGRSRPATSSPAPAVINWSNEGISDIFTLDPADGPDFNARQAMQLIYGGLVRFGPSFHILPDVARRWTVNKDGRIYTFFLRDNVRFGDGTRVTAHDVAFSLNRALSPQFAGNATLLTDIEGAPAVMAGRAPRAAGITVLNDSTIRIRLQTPSGSFLAKLANPSGYIVPSRRVRADPRSWYQHAVGTGPFMVDRWIHNNSLLLVPNPYYYGGKLRVTGIDMPFIPEPLAAYKRYEAGAVDIMGTVHFPTDVLFNVQGRTDFHTTPRLETVFLTLNERMVPFNKPKVREAFARAVDKNAIVRQAYSNFAHPTNAMMPPGLPGYNPKLRGSSYDPALARRLLAEAGYPGGRGLPQIAYPVDQDAQSIILANALATQWRQVLGVHVRLQQHTHSSYLRLLQNLRYQIAVIDWTADFPDPENFVSQQLHTGSLNNNGGWSNTTFDQLVDRADAMPASQDRTRFALYRSAERIAMDQAATIPLVNPTSGILLRSGISGLQINGGYLLAKDWTRVTAPSGSQR